MPTSHGLQALLGQIPVVVWVTDRDLRVQSAIGHDDAWRAAGLDRATAVGSTIQDILHTDRDPVIDLHTAALHGERGAIHYRLRDRYYDVRVEPLEDGDGVIGAALDVTEREVAKVRLEKAQRIAHVGDWEWDVATDRVTWSDELYTIYGLAPDTFGRTYEAFLERVVPEDREATRAAVFDAFRTVKPFTYDHRILHSSGGVRLLHTCGNVTADDRGRVTHMAGVCWDITDATEAKHRADHSLSMLQATLESTADGLVVVDRQGEVVAYNHRLLDLWHVPEQAVEHQRFDVLRARVHEQLANPDQCEHRSHELESQREVESFDSLQFLDGRFFERYSRPQRVDGVVVGRVWSYRDVTEREKLLRSAVFLADASRLLETLDDERALDAVAQLCLAHFAEACAIDQFSSGAPRRIVSLATDPKQSIAVDLPHAALRGNPVIYTVGARSCMTVPIVAHVEVIGALSLAATPGRIYGDADLTLAIELAQRIEMLLENARLYREAREALAARDEFLGIAAHEIRGPLTALLLSVQGLPGTADPAAAKLVAIAEREGRRLSRFVDEMFDVTRIRNGQMSFVYGPVDLVAITREVVERMSTDLTRSCSSLSIAAPASLVGTWDPARVVQVASALLSNAIKFGLGKPIAIAVERDGDQARWSIADHGIGIPPEAHKRIFRPFERVVSVRHYGGLGLGLFIVRSIIDALGGSIRLDSEVGAGSTITVTLPLERAT